MGMQTPNIAKIHRLQHQIELMQEHKKRFKDNGMSKIIYEEGIEKRKKIIKYLRRTKKQITDNDLRLKFKFYRI